MANYRLTPKAKQYRRRQLERLGLDEDKILDILDYEFDLKMGRYPGVPMEGQKYAEGGEVDPLKGMSNADKRRILKIGATGVQNLVGKDYDAYMKLIDNQNKGIRNFAKFRDGGAVKCSTNAMRGTGAAVRGTKFKGVF